MGQNRLTLKKLHRSYGVKKGSFFFFLILGSKKEKNKNKKNIITIFTSVTLYFTVIMLATLARLQTF